MARKTVSEVLLLLGACEWWVKFTERYPYDAAQALKSARRVMIADYGNSRQITENLCFFVVRPVWRKYNYENWARAKSNCVHQTEFADSEGHTLLYPDEMIDELVIEIYERLSYRSSHASTQ